MINFCVPGTRLCLAGDTHIPGTGTYERKGYIYSSLAGIVKITEKEKVFVVEVQTDKGQNIVPNPGDVVTAEVSVITQRYARCAIKCIRDTPLEKPLRALINREEVQATNKDQIEIHKSFRPGDIILARVLPIKELQSYQLTTAENELGVAIAYSDADAQMVPISWTEMQCPVTYNKEYRKVARVLPESDKVDKEK
ncbi:unnamed protein product [Nezara viridula]|uniref:Exosome complex component CSL4 n=1 Tax=Nezara viridula TaxID=85310 RepID=A0A9P0MME2_NEZVI|nr:unnamed protein product [Nezara viridula]